MYEMVKDRRFLYAIGVAGLAHGIAVVAIGFLQRENASLAPNVPELVAVSLQVFENEATSDANEVTEPDTSSLKSQKSRRLPEETVTLKQARSVGTVTSLADAKLADEGESATPESGTKEPVVGSTGTSELVSPTTPRLSRAQLGLGVGDYSHVMTKASPVYTDQQKRLAYTRRLEQSLRQDAEQQAGALGLGKEGPILRQLEQLVQRSPTDLTGVATIVARLRKGGALEFELLGTSSDRFAWNKLLERAKKELLAKKLTTPHGSDGVEYVIRIDSRIQMPSGADPGFGVKLFGIPIRKGEGKRSSRVDVLSSLPKLVVDDSEASKKERGTSIRLELNLLKAPLDPVDLSGKRSRITSARVVKRTLLHSENSNVP